MEDMHWNIDKMYPDQEALLADFDRVKEGTKTLEEYGKDPGNHVKEILGLLEETGSVLEDALVYTHMKQDEDSKKAQSQKNYQAAFQLFLDFSSAVSFFQPWLLSLDKEDQEALLAREDLESYKEFLKKILRYADHTLDKGQEYILSRLSFLAESPSETYYFLTTSDMKFPQLKSLDGAELTQENFVLHEQNSDVKVRKEAFENLYKTFAGMGNTIAQVYNSNIKALVEEARLRHYGSSLEMELFKDNVDVEVYQALVDSIHKNMDLNHRYFAKKKELLGLDDQHMYDVYLPLTKGSPKKYTFEEARDLCIASVAPMGEEYQEIYKTAFEEDWIDPFPREGKAGGAYSSGSYHSQPYILANFNGSLDDVFTIAHEMGHSMHSYYAKKNNDYLYYNYPIFVAEVASTFNENLLLHYLQENASSEEEKLALLDHHLNSFKSTVYRQTMFAEFEKIVHEKVEAGEALTQEDFDAIYLDLNKIYYGDAMISDDLIAHEWMRIPHFYRDFYVYKYATGYVASTVLAQAVLSGEEGALENYFKFLKDGNHHFPIDQLKMAGVDLKDPAATDQALGVFRAELEKLEALDSLN